MKTPLRPLLALLVMSILWGYSWTILKMGLLDAEPFAFTALRIGTGAAALLIALPLSGRKFWPHRTGELFWLGMVQTAILFTLSTWAIHHGHAGRVAFLTYTMPFFTILMAWPILGERVKGMQWLAILFAGLGLTAIIQPWHTSSTGLSNLLAVAAGMAWGVGAILVKRLQKKAPMDLISMTAWQMFFGSLPLIMAAFIIPEAAINWSPRFISVLLFIGVISTAGGWLLWTYALKHLEAGTASMATLAAPVIAMATSAYHFSERPNPLEYLGMALIIAALLTLSFIAMKNRRTAPIV